MNCYVVQIYCLHWSEDMANREDGYAKKTSEDRDS
jgi:hypothetical protein